MLDSMPGPQKKPTLLKQLEGNPGKRVLPANEPQPLKDEQVPVCPAYLKGVARQEWKRVAEELYRIGLLTRGDHAALEGYCVNYARWVDAEKKLAKLSKASSDKMPYLYKTSNGNLIMNPILSVAKQAMEMMHKFATEFGMTPASRARLGGEGGGVNKPKTPMQAILRATKLIVN